MKSKRKKEEVAQRWEWGRQGDIGCSQNVEIKSESEHFKKYRSKVKSESEIKRRKLLKNWERGGQGDISCSQK